MNLSLRNNLHKNIITDEKIYNFLAYKVGGCRLWINVITNLVVFWK